MAGIFSPLTSCLVVRALLQISGGPLHGVILSRSHSSISLSSCSFRPLGGKGSLVSFGQRTALCLVHSLNSTLTLLNSYQRTKAH